MRIRTKATAGTMRSRAPRVGVEPAVRRVRA